ncbi:hypothetical protein SAMN05661096_00911 [Marivirga sericea]|uniref:Uncharacterized protein n=1 Tax=Marivirga sericea TaxID=1028 RepID=A0A1X7IPQ0_9BACT|nr:hypothetical protein [Marivirga sericea]SMG17032.1 hypothetical protein SAMN05661096_00911 [Marivirga sericea]
MSKFTTQELDLASDPTVLLIKYRMIEKVWDYLEDMQKEIRKELDSFEDKLPSELNLVHGKISKGENYKYLPYLMLDFPAFFTKKDIIAFRTMFYWGNFISSTFHLQGKFVQKYGKSLLHSLKNYGKVYFCVNNSPWEYDYKSSNYVLLDKMDSVELEDHVQNTGFIKLSIKFPVEEMPERKTDMMNFLLAGLKVIQTN